MTPPEPNPDDMLSAVDREILVTLLIGGADTPSNISDISDRHYQSIQKRISDLEGDGLVINKGRGVYQLTLSGTETARAIYRESSVEEDLDLPTKK